MWQQFVFAAGAVSFAIALWPSVFTKNKPDIRTSILTGFWLTLYLVVYVTLHFWFAVACEIFCVAGWWTLAWQMRKDWRSLPFVRKPKNLIDNPSFETDKDVWFADETH